MFIIGLVVGLAIMLTMWVASDHRNQKDPPHVHQFGIWEPNEHVAISFQWRRCQTCGLVERRSL